MPLATLSNILDIKSAEGFRGSSVLQQSYPLTGYKTASAAAPFTPLDIAGLTVWLDASAITGLNNNDPVSTWSDLSGNGNNVTQATGSKQPLYKTSQQNGKPGVYFDGVDDQLLITKNFGFSTSATLVAIYKSASATYTVLRTGADTNAKYWRFSGDGRGYWGPFVAVGSRLDGFPPTMPSTNVPAIVVDYSTSTSRAARVNATPYTNASNFWLAPDRIDIGPGGGLPGMTGNVLEVMLYNSSLSVSDIQKIEAYANSKWALY